MRIVRVDAALLARLRATTFADALHELRSLIGSDGYRHPADSV